MPDWISQEINALEQTGFKGDSSMDYFLYASAMEMLAVFMDGISKSRRNIVTTEEIIAAIDTRIAPNVLYYRPEGKEKLEPVLQWMKENIPHWVTQSQRPIREQRYEGI